MNGKNLNRLKLLLAILLFLIGLYGAYTTLQMKNLVHFGHTNFDRGSPLDSPMPIAGAGGGVDSSNDGVAIGLGLFSGFCVFASAKLISEMR